MNQRLGQCRAVVKTVTFRKQNPFCNVQGTRYVALVFGGRQPARTSGFTAQQHTHDNTPPATNSRVDYLPTLALRDEAHHKNGGYGNIASGSPMHASLVVYSPSPRCRGSRFFVVVFSIPSIMFALLLSLIPTYSSRNAVPGPESSRLFSLPPTTVLALCFYQDKTSALSVLVDSHRFGIHPLSYRTCYTYGFTR